MTQDTRSGDAEDVRLAPLGAALTGHCPRCGRGRLFNGFLTMAKRCHVCGLDYSFADPADGPAFFAMSIVSIPAVGFGAWLEFTFEPAIWVHLLTTLPLLVGGSLLLLRPLKGWMVRSQFANKAAEGRVDTGASR